MKITSFNRIQLLAILLLLIASSASGAAKDLTLISVTDSVAETNGCGGSGPSASDGSFVILTGTDTDAGCGDDSIVQHFVDSDGNIVNDIREEAGYFMPDGEGGRQPDLPNPSLAAVNEKTGMVVTSGYYDWQENRKGVVRISSRKLGSYKTFEFSLLTKPLAVAMLNDGNVAMIRENGLDVIVFEPRASTGKLVEVDRVALDAGDNPMKTLKTMIYDPALSALFIGGNAKKDGLRGLARVNVGNEFTKLAWTAKVDMTRGTAKLHLRRKSFDSPAYEVLLLSRHFYVRADVSDGSEIDASRVQDEYFWPWLPYGEAPKAAYDPTRDVIWTTSGTRLRMHSAESGLVEGKAFNMDRHDLDFYNDPPKSWDVTLKDSNPATDLSEQPPYCGTRLYPNHPDVEEGKFVDVDDESNCSNSGRCPYVGRPRFGVTCSDPDVCCIYNDCCILDPSSYFENWRRYPSGDGVGSMAVYVTADRKVHVVVWFGGGVDDEESYYQLSLATFDDDGAIVPDEDEEECTDQTSKTECRNMVTSTGCYWSKTKGCIKAKKCSKIKKNKKACLAASEYDCAWWMRDEKRYVCNDDTLFKACSAARDMTACKTNGCLWSNNDCVKKDDVVANDVVIIPDYFMAFSFLSSWCIGHDGGGTQGRDDVVYDVCGMDDDDKEQDHLWTINESGHWKPFSNIIRDELNKCVTVDWIEEGEKLYLIEECGNAKGDKKKWQFNSSKRTITLKADSSLCVTRGKSDKYQNAMVLKKCDGGGDQQFDLRDVKPPAAWLPAH